VNPKDLHLAEPNYERLCEVLRKDNECLRAEFECLVERCNKVELEKEQLKARIDELEKEKHFLSGQVEAFKYCVKGGAE